MKRKTDFTKIVLSALCVLFFIFIAIASNNDSSGSVSTPTEIRENPEKDYISDATEDELEPEEIYESSAEEDTDPTDTIDVAPIDSTEVD